MIPPGVASQHFPILRSSALSIPCGCLLCANFCSIFSGILKLSVTLFVDRLLFTRQHVARGDVAYRTVKATIVVIAHDLLDDALCLLERQRSLRSNTIALERSVIAFDFSITLWVVETCANVFHAAESNERFKVVGDELWAVVADDPGASLWILLFGILDNRFDIKLLHLWTNVPMVGRLLKRCRKSADESKRCTVLGLLHRIPRTESIRLHRWESLAC